jgi:negative regulator of sigma E activity
MAFLVVCSLLAAGATARAEDTVPAVLDKAIKAHGGAEKLAFKGALHTKSKGTIELAGGLPYTEDVTIQGQDQLKSIVTVEVMGQSVVVTTVFNRDKGWINAQGQTKDMDEKLMGEMKEALYSMRLARFTALKDNKEKQYDVSLVGDDKVEGRDVVGIRVASKRHKDVNLYFDKKTGLLAKITRMALDPMTGQEVSEDRIILEYQEIDGAKVAKKAVVNRDGKKFVEAEVQEVKSLDKVDDSEFAKP